MKYTVFALEWTGVLAVMTSKLSTSEKLDLPPYVTERSYG